MLGLRVNSSVWARHALSSVLILGFITSPLCFLDLTANEVESFRSHGYEWVQRYLNSVDEHTDISEVVNFLMSLQSALSGHGYEIPSLLNMAYMIRNHLLSQNIIFDEDDFADIVEEIQLQEAESIIPYENAHFQYAINCSKNNFMLCKSKRNNERNGRKKKREDGIKLGSKGIFGLVQCFAGGLLAIVPVPGIQAVGVGLITNGVVDLLGDIREMADKNEQDQKREEQRRRETEADENLGCL